MGYWYWRALKSVWELDEATSNKFDLPERGHLSALACKLTIDTAASLMDYDNPYPMQRTTLRVVGNGNVEIVDLRGRQLQAINFWDSGVMPSDHNLTIINNALTQFSVIPFGRYMGDPKYGLILENFAAGVEFEETNTFSTSYYSDTESTFTIFGLFRKNPEPGLFDGGFLKKRQIKKKDTASEEEYDVKLPTTNKLRQIHMFTEPDLTGNVVATAPFTNLKYIFLSIKSKEEHILNNVRSDRWAQFMYQWLARKAHTRIITQALSGGGTVDTMIYEPETVIASTAHYVNALAGVSGSYIWERVQKLYGYTHAGAATTFTCYLDTHGILYHGLIPLLLQTPESDEEEWLDADAMKDVYVSFTEGASTGDIYVVLDELQKTYPS